MKIEGDQTTSEPHKPWVAVKSNGYVLAGHCNYMTGQVNLMLIYIYIYIYIYIHLHNGKRHTSINHTHMPRVLSPFQLNGLP